MALPPEIQYVCDGMSYHMDVTADVTSYLSLFYSGNWDWYDNPDPRKKIHDIADGVFFDWFKSSSPTEKNVCMSGAVAMWKNHFPDLVDSVVSSCVRPLYKKLCNGRGKKELYSRRNIRRAIRKNELIKKSRNIYLLFNSRYIVDENSLLDGYTTGRNILIEREESERRQRYQFTRQKNYVTWKSKRHIKRTRKRNIKAVSMLSKIAGKDMTSVYIGGNEVALRGKQVEFRITKNSFSSTNWNSNSIKIYDLEGNYLSRICVYFDETPAAEQIAGFVLYIQSGMENEIVQNGNLSDISEKGKNHPVIIEALKNKKKAYDDFIIMNDYNDVLSNVISNHMDISLYNGRMGMSDLVDRYRSDDTLKDLIKEEILRIPLFAKIDKWQKVLDEQSRGTSMGNISDYNDTQAVVISNELHNRMVVNAEYNVRQLLTNAINMREELDSRLEMTENYCNYDINGFMV